MASTALVKMLKAKTMGDIDFRSLNTGHEQKYIFTNEGSIHNPDIQYMTI